MKIDSPHTKFLVDEFNSNKAVAFIIEYPTASQKAFSLINNINDYLASHPINEISLYVEHRFLPVEVPCCAIFHTLELCDFFGSLVATTVATWRRGDYSDRSKKYLYVYDIVEFMNERGTHQAIKNSPTVVFTRNAEYKKIIESTGISVHNILVPECEIDLIMQILEIYG